MLLENVRLLNGSKRIKVIAKEALSNGDKILSENYYQHADHFTRIYEKQNEINSIKNVENYTETNFTEKKLV